MKIQGNIFKKKLIEFVEKDAGNRLQDYENIKMYDPHLIGVASAYDKLFDMFKKPEIIGPDYLKPGEWLNGATSVLSYFLPFTKEIRDSNRKPGLPSKEWVSGRIEGETFNNSVRIFLLNQVEVLGGNGIAPVLDPRFRVSDKRSNWSERHAAFAAGLGTFGLHRALITKKGTCGRIGSVITDLNLYPTPRPYTKYYEYCIFLNSGKCGACKKRCPCSAIASNGKNNQICSDYIDSKVLPVFKPRYGCAKCNINVPCERGIPKIAKL